MLQPFLVPGPVRAHTHRLDQEHGSQSLLRHSLKRAESPAPWPRNSRRGLDAGRPWRRCLNQLLSTTSHSLVIFVAALLYLGLFSSSCAVCSSEITRFRNLSAVLPASLCLDTTFVDRRVSSPRYPVDLSSLLAHRASSLFSLWQQHFGFGWSFSSSHTGLNNRELLALWSTTLDLILNRWPRCNPASIDLS